MEALVVRGDGMKVHEWSGELADGVSGQGGLIRIIGDVRADALWPLLHPAFVMSKLSVSLSGNCILVALSCFICMYKIGFVTLLVQLA